MNAKISELRSILSAAQFTKNVTYIDGGKDYYYSRCLEAIGDMQNDRRNGMKHFITAIRMLVIACSREGYFKKANNGKQSICEKQERSEDSRRDHECLEGS